MMRRWMRFRVTEHLEPPCQFGWLNLSQRSQRIISSHADHNRIGRDVGNDPVRSLDWEGENSGIEEILLHFGEQLNRLTTNHLYGAIGKKSFVRFPDRL